MYCFRGTHRHLPVTDPAPPAAKLKVFISYSRSDMAFADRLVEALEARGYKCLIDRRDLQYGEIWKSMLREFIEQSDSVVYLVSPRSIGSQWCRWELAEVAKLAKRLIPLVLEPVTLEKLPPEIGSLHLMPFTESVAFEPQVNKLDAVLTTDRGWVVEHTRLTALAQRWHDSNRQRDGLLVGSELAAAEAWLVRPTSGGLQQSPLVQSYISEGRANALRVAKQKTRIASAVAAGALLLAAFAGWQYSVAEKNFRASQIAESNYRTQQATKVLEDAPTSALVALEAVPDKAALQSSQRDRPLVPEAWNALHAAWIRQLSGPTLRRHVGLIFDAAFSADGAYVVTASEDGTARISQTATGKSLALLEGHRAALMSAAFSPDGGRVLTASRDKTARIWDASTGALLAVFEGHQGSVIRARFSRDGKRVLTASSDGTARLWDAGTGNATVAFSGHTGPVNDAVFSPDENLVLTASADTTARLWNASTGNAIAVLEGHKRSLLSAIFSPDGSQLLTIPDDKTARLWSAKSGRFLRSIAEHEDRLTGADFSPDGKYVVTSAKDGTARIWETATGKEHRRLDHKKSDVLTAKFSHDGRQVVTGSESGYARLWNAETGQLVEILEDHMSSVHRASFSSDDRNVLTVSSNGSARLWHAAPGKPRAILQGKAGTGIGIGVIGESIVAVYAPDGGRVAMASADGTVQISSAATGAHLRTIQAHQSAIYSVRFSPDGRRLATAGGDQTARVWDAESGDPVGPPLPHGAYVLDAAFSPDGARILTGALDGTVRLWDYVSGQAVRTLKAHSRAVTSAVFSPDGKRFLTASADGDALVWEVGSQEQEPVEILEGKSGPINSAVFSLDGHLVLTAANGSAWIWILGATERPRELAGHTTGSAIRRSSFSPDGTKIVTASDDNTARIWDAKSGATIAVLEGHTWRVFDAVFSRDGRRILTASGDNTARLWDSDSGKLLATLEGHTSWVTSARFSPDGSRILTASKDGTARVWDSFPDWQDLVDQVKTDAPRCLSIDQRKDFALAGPVPDWCRQLDKWPTSIDAHVEEAFQHLRKDETAQATPLIEEVAKRDSAVGPIVQKIRAYALIDRATALLREFKDNDADKLLESASTMDPTAAFRIAEARVSEYMQRGYDLLGSKRDKDAELAFNQAIAINPTAQSHVEERWIWAHIARGRDQMESLERAVDRAETNPADALDRALNEFDTAVQRAEGKHVVEFSQALAWRGKVFDAKGDYARAVADLRTAANMGEYMAIDQLWWSAHRFAQQARQNGNDFEALVVLSNTLVSLPDDFRRNIRYKDHNASIGDLAQMIWSLSAGEPTTPPGAPASECDRMMSSPALRTRPYADAAWEGVDVLGVLSACSVAPQDEHEIPRYFYLRGLASRRAGLLSMTSGDQSEAQRRFSQAAEDLRSAAGKDYPIALIDLAMAYEQGEGVPKDVDKAAELRMRAFSQMLKCCWAQVARRIISDEESLSNAASLDRASIHDHARKFSLWAAALGSSEAQKVLAEYGKNDAPAPIDAASASPGGIPNWLAGAETENHRAD